MSPINLSFGHAIGFNWISPRKNLTTHKTLGGFVEQTHPASWIRHLPKKSTPEAPISGQAGPILSAAALSIEPACPRTGFSRHDLVFSTCAVNRTINKHVSLRMFHVPTLVLRYTVFSNAKVSPWDAPIMRPNKQQAATPRAPMWQ